MSATDTVRRRFLALSGVLCIAAGGCSQPQQGNTEDVTADRMTHWPELTHQRQPNPDTEARIDAILASLSTEEKVGQLIQADIAHIEPADLLTYPLGSILNGGNSAPHGDVRIGADEWLALADEFHAAAMAREGGTYIPLLWGTDAVHGHNNVVGATIFPHNIGLGAARDPDLMLEIGRITALETVITGQDWSFAPTVAVARNDRWGRTYESYSENPDIVAAYAGKIVEGLQGPVQDAQRLRGGYVLSSAKHFVGDGGTYDGIDQGDTRVSEADLARIHAAGYPSAIEAGVEIVMASFNSWHGNKLHGHQYLLTDVLKKRWGFDGFVVGDWNGHGQVNGCRETECPAAIMAGLDMFMAPDSWRELYANTLRNVRDGTITEARLNDAVRRILRVKIRSGVFEKPRPSERQWAGQFDLLGSESHRATAREAARKSLVLLKNTEDTLPLNPTSRVLVTGAGAHDMGMQTGGWTLSWQGSGNGRAHFPNADTIWEGIESHVAAAGGIAIHSADGSYEEKPDVAIVVFGEQPYAEFQGDRNDVAFRDTQDHLALLQQYHAQGIRTVSVFLSGRPLWVNRHLNVSDAFVAAWLPGSEGAAIADVIFADRTGAPRFDFTGKLSFSWPNHPQHDVLDDEVDASPLYVFGYGMGYGDVATAMAYDELPDVDLTAVDTSQILMTRGTPVRPWSLMLRDEQFEHDLGGRARLDTGYISIARQDFEAQEDALRISWQENAHAVVSGREVDWSRAANADLSLYVEAHVDPATVGDLNVSLGCGAACLKNVAVAEIADAGTGWQTLSVPLKCLTTDNAALSDMDEPVILAASGPATISLHAVHIGPTEGPASCSQ